MAVSVAIFSKMSAAKVTNVRGVPVRMLQSEPMQSCSDHLVFWIYIDSLPMKEFNIDIALEDMPVSGCTCFSTCANKLPDTLQYVYCCKQNRAERADRCSKLFRCCAAMPDLPTLLT